MIFLSPAKLNLVLKIKNKDPKDNYHYIESIFDPISLYDILDVEITRGREIRVIDYFKKLKISEQKNIVYKAVKLMAEKYKFKFGVKITLYKHIPDGAGMGGGSSNAAAAIMALNKLLGLKLGNAEMAEIGFKCGSDVPFFIYGKPAYAAGKGEKIREYPRKVVFWYVIVVHKAVKVATKDAYGWYDSEIHLTKAKSYTNIMYGYKNGAYAFLYNDFENVIFRKYPVLKQVRDSLLKHHCIDASLSGSGSAVFALYDSRHAALAGYIKAGCEWKGSFVGLAHSI